MLFEFLIPRRPVSSQTRRKEVLRQWKAYVSNIAAQSWDGSMVVDDDIRLSLVYMCDDSPADIDNIVKPIQDSLIGLIYLDDNLVSDVDSHRRFLTKPLDGLPDILRGAIESGEEAVYVSISKAENLQVYL